MTRAIKERPLLFSAPMVRALLDGTKTQTRRVVPTWQQPAHDPSPGFPDMEWGAIAQRDRQWGFAVFGMTAEACARELAASGCCPYGQPGDRLWVRETHRPIFGQTCGLICVDYRADPREKWERLGDAPDCLIKSKWTPSIHMRREYSRILLEVVSVRVERLQEISDQDAIAEGIVHQKVPLGVSQRFRFYVPGAGVEDTAVTAYRELWKSINGADSWDANPWVWVVEFKRIIEEDGNDA